jgi:hypothetical protein
MVVSMAARGGRSSFAMAVVVLLTIWLIPPPRAAAAPKNVQLTYATDVSWPHDETATWVLADIGAGDGVRPRRLAVSVLADGAEIMRLWDNPQQRLLPFITFDMPGPRAKITLRPVIYEGMAWRPKRMYKAGDKLSVGAMFPGGGYWLCVRGGKSGAQEPDWSAAIQGNYAALLDGSGRVLYGAVVDNGNGTVTLSTFSGLALSAGAAVTIAGTVNYNGDYILPDQTGAGTNQIILAHAYVAESFTVGTEVISLTDGRAVDLGSGLVKLPCPGHGRAGGELVTISGSINYNGDYPVPDQALGDANHLVIQSAYVAEIIGPAAQVSWPVLDPDAGGVLWQWQGNARTDTGSPTGRVVVRDSGSGVVERTGTSFILRHR